MTRYWWVNQNQTFNEEATGGFMWSPKTNKDGKRSHYYDNMTLIQPGDVIFSYVGTAIKAVGVALSKAYEGPKPTAFGSKGSNWLNNGWKVDVDYTRLNGNFKPKMFMDVIAPELPGKHSPLRASGTGNQAYLFEISANLGKLLLELSNAPELEMEVTSLADLTFDEEEQSLISDATLSETVKATLVQARRGQGQFRKRVHLVEIGCRVTQVTAEKLLVASHIKPWKDSNNEERMSGNNGLFLSPHIDALFDKGYITFSTQGEMLVSPQLEQDVLTRWKINPSKSVGKFNEEQKYFLDFHNRERFKAS
jgi:putative restriction endonuclease